MLFMTAAHSVLMKFRVRTAMSLGNKIHSSTLWTHKNCKNIYMATLGYPNFVKTLCGRRRPRVEFTRRLCH